MRRRYIGYNKEGFHHEGTKDTKGSDNNCSERRALRVFVVKQNFQ